MKNSSSTTSLTDLITVKDVDECFICLEGMEPLVDGSILRSCGCKFIVHPDCWNAWIKDKTEFDCPICRRDSLNRLPITPVQQPQVIVLNRSYYIYASILTIFGIGVIVGILVTQLR